MEAQLTRQTIRDAETLTIAESERLKRLRFDANPICDGCDGVIEEVADAALITSIGDGQMLIHNKCWMSALNKIAFRAQHMRGRR